MCQRKASHHEKQAREQARHTKATRIGAYGYNTTGISDDEIDVIISWIDQIAERGALERYFRPEGTYGDGVGVIPIDVGNKLRLYCLRLSNKILVFGNGGVKDTRSWQESETLAPYVNLLVDTSRFISSRIKDGTMVLVDKEIVGNLNFTRYEDE